MQHITLLFAVWACVWHQSSGVATLHHSNLQLRGGSPQEASSTAHACTSELREPGTNNPEPVVTAFEVRGTVDYDKLINQFGSEPLGVELVGRIERITGRTAHHLLRRGFFFSHRDLTSLLDAYEAGNPFYLYTGRGPSSEALHLGHLIPFIITKWLQEAFQVPVVIQLTDDEKFLWKGRQLEDYRRFALENARDIMAVGFDLSKTYIFTDTDAIKELYPNILHIQRLVTFNQARAIFGFQESDSIGKVAFPAVQAAPAFSSSFPSVFPTHPDLPCLVPCAIDQDPYFRLTRDVAKRMGRRKPALLHSKFIPSLEGETGKMSASDAATAIFLTDTAKQVKTKINKFAFSGGQSTVEEHRRLGGDPTVDVAFRYLEFFLEDDAEVGRLREEYVSGKLLSGEMKAKAIDCVQRILAQHQRDRESVTADVLSTVMTPRPLALPA